MSNRGQYRILLFRVIDLGEPLKINMITGLLLAAMYMLVNVHGLVPDYSLIWDGRGIKKSRRDSSAGCPFPYLKALRMDLT